MADTDDRFRFPPELVTGALVAAATLPLARLFSGGGIGGVIVGTLLLSAVVAWALRRLRVPAIPGAILSAAAFAWFASALWARDAMWGPFPTPDSIRSLLDTITAGARSAQVEVAPVFAARGLKVLIASLVWGLAWLADDAVAKLRHPLLAIAFCLPIVVFPGTLLPAGRWWFDSALFLVASLAVLFTDERIRLARWGRLAGLGRHGWRPGLAARMGAVVIVAALAVSPLVPTEAQIEGSGGPGGTSAAGGFGLNPLVSILPRLNTTPAVTLFTVTSPVRSYWRLTSLDSFDGRLWVSRLHGSSTLVSGRSVPPDVSAPSARRVVQEYRFRRLGGQSLPAAYDPIRVEGRSGVRLSGSSRALLSGSRIVANQNVRVVSLVPGPDAAALDAIGEISDPRLTPYLRLPADIPREITALAREITRNEATPFRKAVALQEHFKTYVYDENVAAGHSIRNLTDFIEQRRGYCEQFAGTMAVLARSVGIPARVAIGFAVGEPVGKDAYRVTSRNAHAWVEIFFPGQGWITFEPTPRPEGGVEQPSYTRPDALVTAPTGGPDAIPTSEPTGGPDLDPRLLQEGDVPNFVETPPAPPRRNWTPFVAAVLVLGAIVLLPGASAMRRIRRRRRASGPVENVRVAYLDFLDWCAAVRVPRWPSETPAEYARRLAGISIPAEGPALALASLATEALYGPSAAPDPADAYRAGAQARHAIATTLPRRVRILPIIGWGWWRAGG